MSDFFALIIAFLFILVLILPAMVILHWPEKYRRIFTKKTLHKSFEVGRNDKCPCGSNVKFKKCCGVESRGKLYVQDYNLTMQKRG